MNERDSVKKLVMDSASQIALTEHLDTVRFCLQPPEYSYGDYISVTFYKEQQAVGNLFSDRRVFKDGIGFPFVRNQHISHNDGK